MEELVRPVVTADGLELFDVRFGGGALQVFVDRPGGGVDLDTVGRVTRKVSDLLDEHDPLPGSYTLEVSSPGLERDLRRPDHFRRFLGTEVKVKTRPGVDGARREQGVIEVVDDDAAFVNGRRLAYADIESARTVFSWGAQTGTAAGTPR
ncbi:MAG: ribosome maturation factor RimP [Acidimicrobiales bacterium]